MMRILQLNYEYPPLGGGAGVATAALADGLVESGATVDVVTVRAEGAEAAGVLYGSQRLREEGALARAYTAAVEWGRRNGMRRIAWDVELAEAALAVEQNGTTGMLALQARTRAGRAALLLVNATDAP